MSISKRLFWEGKIASPATSRLGTSTYTNFDSTSSGQKTDGSNPIQAEINASTNSIGYVNSVNASGLCGYTDWRLPTKSVFAQTDSLWNPPQAHTSTVAGAQWVYQQHASGL